MSTISLETPTPTRFGHPRGLFVLFNAEMWERFSFYGMRAILVLYMTKVLMFDDDQAAGVYAAYCAIGYMLSVAGGYIAEKVLGYRRAIIAGALLMACGQGCLALQSLLGGSSIGLYIGLALLCVGNGFFKPNIASTVGKLYANGDPRRDAGFTIFYMGVNLGCAIAPIVCSHLGQQVAWPLGFLAACVGMILGIGWFAKGTRYLEGKDEPQDPSRLGLAPMIYGAAMLVVAVVALLLWQSAIVGWLLVITAIGTLGILLKTAFAGDRIVRDRMLALIALMGFHGLFFAFFEQAGSSLTLFADRVLDRNLPLLGEMPAGWFLMVNGFFILVLGLPFSALWTYLSNIGKQPSIPVKFALGLIRLGLGFGVLCLGAHLTGAGDKVPWFFLFGMYFLHTTGELCISPVGLSAVTKLAPAKIVGFVMGAWFLSVAGGHELAGEIAKLTKVDATQSLESMLGVYGAVYQNVFIVATVAGLLLLALATPIRKLMHGVD